MIQEATMTDRNFSAELKQRRRCFKVARVNYRKASVYKTLCISPREAFLDVWERVYEIKPS